MRLTVGSPRQLVQEVPWVAVTAGALLATFVVEHYVVHELIVLPALLESPQAPPWTVAALVGPELVALFGIGYRLRTALAVAMHAGVAVLLRFGFTEWLAATGQPGHADGRLASVHVALSIPLLGLAYLLVLALASASAAEQRKVEGGA